MLAKYILAGLSLAFLLAAVLKASRVGLAHPQVRTWLVIAVVFAAVSGWLFTQR